MMHLIGKSSKCLIYLGKKALPKFFSQKSQRLLVFFLKMDFIDDSRCAIMKLQMIINDSHLRMIIIKLSEDNKMANSPTFIIDGLKASVEGKEILKGLSLTIKGGEIHAIMGPNGTGKS